MGGDVETTGHVDKHWAIFKLNAGKLNMALDRKLVGCWNGSTWVSESRVPLLI